MTALLNGIRVLDFGRYIAGPYCAALLAEYGADVIRVEKRSGSEDRFPAQIGGGVGATFMQMNRNKRSITLDPVKPEGREVVARLVAGADIVVANLPAASLRDMGLDYATLCGYRRDIILVTSTAFGPAGPMSGNVGFDGIGQAMCGSAYMTGQLDQPYRSMANWVDFSTALHCAFGTLAALMQRQTTGQGQVVTGALLATALAVFNAPVIEQAVAQANRVPLGNRAQAAAPNDIYRSRDGWVLVAVNGQPLFARWARLMAAPGPGGPLPDDPDWLADPRFASDDLRGRHGEIVGGRTARWCAVRHSSELVAVLGEAKIPCAPVLSPQQVLEHPQVQALGLLQDTDYPGLPRPAPVAAVPLWLSGTPPVPRLRPPLLGEHTDAVLAEAGYSAEQIAGLRQRRVV